MNKKLLGIMAGATLLASFAAVLPGALAKDGGDNNEQKTRQELKAVGSTLEIHIFDNGKVLVRGAKVTAVSGNTVSATTAWSSTSIAWTVATDGSTEFVRRSSGQSGVSEITVGDYISFNGDLVATGSGFTVNASVLKNWSTQQKKSASFIGKVLSLGTNSFVLTAEEHGNVTVGVTSTTSFTKGDSNAAFGDIHVGDKVLASGIFNNALLTLEATKIKIYVDKNAEQHTFEGSLKTLPGAALPTYFVLTLSENTDVTVNLPVGISIVNKSYLVAALSDFRTGDKIRVWGLQAGSTIDATVVRNTNLPR